MKEPIEPIQQIDENQNISTEISKSNEGLYSLKLELKNFKPEYFLILEDILSRHLKDNQIYGELCALQRRFHIPNIPLFDLRNSLLKEVQNKIDRKWKNISG